GCSVARLRVSAPISGRASCHQPRTTRDWRSLPSEPGECRIRPSAAAVMTQTEKFRTERLVARSWQVEDLPLAMELWGDPAVTALIDSRGKLTKAQIGSGASPKAPGGGHQHAG